MFPFVKDSQSGRSWSKQPRRLLIPKTCPIPLADCFPDYWEKLFTRNAETMIGYVVSANDPPNANTPLATFKTQGSKLED